MHCWKFGEPLAHKICVPNAYPVVVPSLECDQISNEISSFADETCRPLQFLWTHIQNRERFDVANQL